MPKYLIDGNNLIGHTEGLSLTSPNCRQQLIDRLLPFCNTKRKRALVFFDGARTPLSKGVRIEIRFSGPNRTADDLIRREVERSPTPKDLCVVSSDGAVYSYARGCGSQALRCHEFNRRLNDVANAPTDSGKPLNPDTEYWLKQFSGPE